MKYILVLGLFLSLVLVYGMELGDTPYFVLFLSMSLIVGGYLIKFFQGRSIGFRLNFLIKDFSPVDKFLSSTLIWLWLLIIVSWLIGVLIGLVNGVDPSLVFRNFFGLVVYIIFPVMLIVSPSLRSLIIMLFLAGIVQMCYGFERSYWLIINPAAFSNVLYSFSELRSFYNTGFIVIFPLFMVGVARQLLPKHYFPNNYGQMVTRLSNSLIFTLLTLIALVVPAMSKAYILETTILFLSVVFFSISYSLKTGRIHKNIMLLVFLVVLLYLLLPSSFYEVIIHSYSSQEVSNFIKIEQFGYLASELTFFGNGLGSSLRSGYAAAPRGYGFELTYVNIVHKLGVFSIFLFSSYVITLMVAWIRIVRRVYIFESLFVIGLMGYLVVGAGNPILLATSAVILHCVAMYILVKPFLRPLKENQVESYS
ncbi:hypothetical protein KJ830_07720 [bacterium]|nr:hypothetical protein [bacterium]MBU4510916.1 hypothetical protein [bacterium]